MRKYNKGYNIKKSVNDYSVIDIETTGLSYYKDKIIEIGMLKIRDGKIIAKYQQLIDPQTHIKSFITNLTGISNEMILNKPILEEIYDEVFNFIGKDIIIGHNVSFDLSFIANQFKIDIQNQYIDTLYYSRILFPELSHHSLSDMVKYLNLSHNEHRAMADCIATYELYEYCKKKKRYIK